MKDFDFLNIVKSVDPTYEGVTDIPTTGFIDTSSYALNALISASIYGGIPNNRSIMWAGDPSTGKTFLSLSVVRQFLNDNPEGACIYFDTEFALEKDMLVNRGIDVDRFFHQQPETLQDFRTKALNILDKFGESNEKTRPPLMMVLDSLGNLPTVKEVADSTAGNDTRDMTKAQIIKSIFRVLTIKLGKLAVPMQITNHTYDSMDQYKPKEISGGSGAKYASSIIVTLSKSKDKDGDDVVGNIITATTYKSRYSKEAQKVKLKLNFDTGLDRYYGLLEIAEEVGVFKKVSTRYELPDGTKVFGKSINDNPTKYYTKEILDKIDAGCKTIFGLGTGGQQPIIEDETEHDEDGVVIEG